MTAQPTTPGEGLRDEDLPAGFRAADQASLEAQRRYLWLVRIDLVSLCLGAILTSFQYEDPAWNRFLAVAGAVLLAVGLVITTWLNQKAFKRQWYGGRAAAESIKSLAWRYMMRAEPYGTVLDRAAADRNFGEAVLRILKDVPDLSIPPGTGLGTDPIVTVRMREVRAKELPERKTLYLQGRIGDQQQWYTRKADISARKEERFFWLIVGAQLLALLTALGLVLVPGFWVQPVGFFSTLAAAFLAWLQVKQHEELTQAYRVAAYELGLIAAEAEQQHDEASFSQFVADAESAISREHTLWLARRDSYLALRKPA
jgi:hypothetical protein